MYESLGLCAAVAAALAAPAVAQLPPAPNKYWGDPVIVLATAEEKSGEVVVTTLIPA